MVPLRNVPTLSGYVLCFLMRWPIRSNILKVAILTVLSRFGGLIRDSLLAWLIGAGAVADAYTTALRIPNMLRDLLGEGALSSVIVSRLGALRADPTRCKLLVRQLVGFWGSIMTLVVVLGVCFSNQLVSLVAGGFSDVEKFNLSVQLTQRIFPYIGIVGLAAMTMGVLHHLKVFTWSSAASSFYNLTMIIMLLMGAWLFGDDPNSLVAWIAGSVVFSGIVQWFSQLPGFRGTGYSMLPSFKFKDPELKRIVLMLFPSVMSVAAVQVNVLVNHRYASELGDGAVASMYFAFRLMQLPVGVVGVAVSTVLLPTLGEHIRKGNDLGFGEEIAKSLITASFLSVPAVLGLTALGPQLVSVLYQRGEFDEHAAQVVWFALQGFLLGVLPYVYKKNLEQGFFAKGDTKTPLKISLFSIFVNASLNGTMVFALDLGLRGLCLGTSMVLWGNALLLIVALKKRHGVRFPLVGMLKNVLGMFVLSVAMYGFVGLLKKHLPFEDEILQVLTLASAGGAFYLGVAFLLKKTIAWDLRKLI